MVLAMPAVRHPLALPQVRDYGKRIRDWSYVSVGWRLGSATGAPPFFLGDKHANVC